MLCCSLSGFTQTIDNELKSTFEEKITTVYKDYNLAGDFIMGIVDETGLIYSYAINREILEGKNSNLSINSPIYVASHTKALTGTLLKIMEEKGEIDLDKTLKDYLPELNYRDSIDTEAITIRKLLNHTHGTYSNLLTWKTAILGYEGENYELIQNINTDFLHDPSGNFRYSNVGPIISAMVLEEQTGKSWKELMQKEIFESLQMTKTSSMVSDYTFEEIRPSVVVDSEGDIHKSGFYKSDITMHAAGGTISTVSDLSKWLMANINQDKKLLSKEGWADMHTASTAQNRTYFTYKRFGYSLGWDLATYQSDTLLTRFGSLAGISFHASFIPSKKLGIIALSTDDRAAYLPSLAANLGYNLLAQVDYESFFNEELKLFENTYEEYNNPDVLGKDRLFGHSQQHDMLVGSYTNDIGWPAINIRKSADGYILQWGTLQGNIYYDQDGFVADLGLMERGFSMKGDSLFTGSLKYIKSNN